MTRPSQRRQKPAYRKTKHKPASELARHAGKARVWIRAQREVWDAIGHLTGSHGIHQSCFVTQAIAGYLAARPKKIREKISFDPILVLSKQQQVVADRYEAGLSDKVNLAIFRGRILHRHHMAEVLKTADVPSKQALSQREARVREEFHRAITDAGLEVPESVYSDSSQVWVTTDLIAGIDRIQGVDYRDSHICLALRAEIERMGIKLGR